MVSLTCLACLLHFYITQALSCIYYECPFSLHILCGCRHTHTTLLREQYLRESVMSTQQPLSVKTMLGIRAQIHIQWTSLRDRRHRSAHTEIRTHLTHTQKTNELPKLAEWRCVSFSTVSLAFYYICVFICMRVRVCSSLDWSSRPLSDATGCSNNENTAEVA